MQGDSNQPSKKLQQKHPQAQAVLKIIDDARKHEGKNFKKAIQLLDKAKKLLPQLDQGKGFGSNQTMENNTVQNANEELTYWSKLANIYYNIHKYDKANQIYQKLVQKIPGNPRLQKALGDSLRHLQKYDEAIQIYEQGMKICTIIKSYAQFGANILNSEGLTYMAQEKYDDAITKFQAAINITPKNALYLVNAGAAYQAKGNKDKAMQAYQGAQKLLKTPLEDVGLTKDNVKFIQKSLNKFLQNLKKLQSIQIQDDAFNSRVNNYGNLLNKLIDQGLNNPKDSERTNPETQAKNLYDAQKILKMLDEQGNVNLKRFYKGMQGTLQSSYINAAVVQQGTVQLNTGNLAASVASNLAGFLPVIGSQLSSAINFASNFITANQINKQACNILLLATDSKQFQGIAQDVVLKVIYNNKDYLVNSNPQQYVLPAWAHSFEAAAKWLKEKKEAFEGHLFGNRFTTEHSRYGFKLATDLLSKHVATGKLYKNDTPEDIPLDQIKKRLCSAAEEIFKADKDVQKDRSKLAKEGKLPQQQPQSKKCQIY